MITLTKTPSFTWIDIENPTILDIERLIAEFAVHPLFADKLKSPNARAKTESNDEAFFAALHYPDHPSIHKITRDIEVDYVISDKLLVTAHYEPIDIFIDIKKEFEASTLLGRAFANNTTDLFLKINNELYKGLREEIEPFRHEIKIIESEIFNGREFHMVEEISQISRRLLDFKQSIRPHKIILKSFEIESQTIFSTHINSDMVMREYSRVESALENCHEMLSELRRTNDSLLTAKNNEVTKKLTLMAFVTFPLTLVATVLEYRGAPEVFQGTHGFWVILATLVILLAIMQIYFVYKKWI